jgi:hypothetical protein
MYDSEVTLKPFFDEGLRMIREHLPAEAARSKTSRGDNVIAKDHTSPSYAQLDFTPENIDELSDYVLRSLAEHELADDDVTPEAGRALMPPTLDEVADMVANVALVSFMAEEECRAKLASSMAGNAPDDACLVPGPQVKRMRAESAAGPPVSAAATKGGASEANGGAILSGSRALHQRLPSASSRAPPPAPAESDPEANALKNRFKSAKQQHVEEVA